MAARITVNRQSGEDIRDRQIVLSLDGQKFATLLYGQSVTREIESGTHWLRAHNTLVWRTLDFELGHDEHAIFTVVNRPGLGTYLLLSLLGSGPVYLELRREG